MMLLNWENSEVSEQLSHQSVATKCKDDVEMPPSSLTCKILKGETTKIMDFEVCLMLRVDTTRGTRLHVDKILISSKQVLFHIWTKDNRCYSKNESFVSK
jgi:hypothetical protein